MLTLFPRPSRRPSPPTPPEQEPQPVVPVEAAAESPGVERRVEESVAETLGDDQRIQIDEPSAIGDSVAADQSITREGHSGTEESFVAEPSLIETSDAEADVTGTSVTDEPVAAELPPTDSNTTQSVGGEGVEVGSDLIEWETVEPSEEVPVPVDAATEFPAAESSADQSSVAGEISEPDEANTFDAAAHQALSAESSMEDSESVELAALGVAPEALTAAAIAAADVDQAEVEEMLQASGAQQPLTVLPLVEESSLGSPMPKAETAIASDEWPALVESVAVGSDAHEDCAPSESGLLDLPRVAEPEVMDDPEEVQAYASAAAQAWLNSIDASFVEHAARLVKERQRGRALDIGTGPGQITLKLALRLSLWKFIGVDRSQIMIDEALSNLATTIPVTGRLQFHTADGNRLDYPDASFDLVVCNSVLHHFAEPQNLLAEMARVVKPRGAILLRDLRRPSRMEYPFHVRWHGRRYTGNMNKLYRDSVRAAYTVPELQRLLDASSLRGAHVFKHGSTHIGIERPYNW